MKCEKCGGSLRYQPGDDKVKCDFCGHVSVIDDGGHKPITPKSIVPFKVNMARAERATLAWIADDKTSPVDVVEKANFISKRAIYVPVYWAKAYLTADWSASFGYDYQEVTRVWNPSTKMYDTHTVTRTDWRPASGRASTVSECLAIANEGGLPSLPPKASELITSISTAGVDDFDEAYLQGMEVLPFEPMGSRHKAQFKAAYLESVRQAVFSHAKGDRQRDWNFDPNLEKEKISTLYVPVYVMEWEYKALNYTTVVDGWDPTHRMGSPLPVDASAQEALDSKKTLRFWMCCGWAVLIVATLLSWAGVVRFHDTLLYFIMGWGLVHVVLYAYLASVVRKKLGNMANIRLELLKNRLAQDGLLEHPNATIGKPPALLMISFEPLYRVMKGAVAALVVLLGFVSMWWSPDKLLMLTSEVHEETFPVIVEEPVRVEASVSKPSLASAPAPKPKPEPMPVFSKGLDESYPSWQREFVRIVFKQYEHVIGQDRQRILDQVKALNSFQNKAEVPVADMAPIKVAMQASNYKEAIRLMEKLTPTYSGDATLDANLGYAYLKEKAWRPAFERIVQAIVLDPEEWRYWGLLLDLCSEVEDLRCTVITTTMKGFAKNWYSHP